jgi:protein TonB
MLSSATLIRFGIALAVAAGITFAVFFAMQALINTGESAMTEGPDGRVVDFVKVDKEEQVQKKDRQPEKPPKPPEEPPKPDMPKPSQNMDTAMDASMGIAGANVAGDLQVDTGISGGSGDGEYLPIVKVAPVYPQRALRRGIEGYVVVEFTVTTSGAVTDPRVIEADPPGVFNHAAMEAAKKFKYKPKVVNGKPIEVAGVRNIIRFELDR